MKRHQKILFATDLTDANFKIAEDALEIVKQNDSQLHLLHAIDTFPSYAFGYGELKQFENAMEDEAQKLLFDLGKQLGLEKEFIYLKHNPSKLAIIELARELNVGLIIVGSHSQQGILGSLGSTAAGVVNSAPCDVLVLKQKED
jgi:universal stress protein A